MNFDELEVSTQDGKPIALYEFTQGLYSTNGRGWFFNTSDRDITWDHPLYGSIVYKAESISDDGVTISGGNEDNEAAITVPVINAVSQLFNGTPPSVQINVTIRRIHYEDDEAPIYWMGFISSRKTTAPGQATLRCNALIATFSRGGLRLAYERQCPHPLYVTTTCKAIKVPLAGVVVSLTGNSIVADIFATKDDGRFNAGYLEWTIVGTLTESRQIDQHVGNTVTILGATDGLSVGQSFTAYIGCLHNREDCHGSFTNATDDPANGNLGNYGGFAHMPGKSPYDGDPVF